jgi:hypothetical protein
MLGASSEREASVPRRQTLLEYIFATVGFRKGRKIVTFMLSWDLVESKLGYEPTVEEYAHWWKESASSGYREQALFRECFPAETSPSRLLHDVRRRRQRVDMVALGEVAYAAT